MSQCTVHNKKYDDQYASNESESIAIIRRMLRLGGYGEGQQAIVQQKQLDIGETYRFDVDYRACGGVSALIQTQIANTPTGSENTEYYGLTKEDTVFYGREQVKVMTYPSIEILSIPLNLFVDDKSLNLDNVYEFKGGDVYKPQFDFHFTANTAYKLIYNYYCDDNNTVNAYIISKDNSITASRESRIGNAQYEVIMTDFTWSPRACNIHLKRTNTSSSLTIPKGTKVTFNSYTNQIVGISDGLSYESITPTSKDNEFIAEGKVPPSLIYYPDNPDVHLNAKGYDLMAHLIYEQGKSLGYFN